MIIKWVLIAVMDNYGTINHDFYSKGACQHAMADITRWLDKGEGGYQVDCYPDGGELPDFTSVEFGFQTTAPIPTEDVQ